MPKYKIYILSETSFDLILHNLKWTLNGLSGTIANDGVSLRFFITPNDRNKNLKRIVDPMTQKLNQIFKGFNLIPKFRNRIYVDYAMQLSKEQVLEFRMQFLS